MHRYLSTGPSTIAALMAACHPGRATPRDTAPATIPPPDLTRPARMTAHPRRLSPGGSRAGLPPLPEAGPQPPETTP